MGSAQETFLVPSRSYSPRASPDALGGRHTASNCQSGRGGASLAAAPPFWLVVHGAGASSKASSLLVRRPPCGRRRPWTVQRRPHPRTIGAVGARGAVVSSSNVAGGYKALRVKARAVFVRRPPREHRRSWSYGGVLLPPVCEQQYVGCRCLGATADVRRCRRTRAR